MSDLLTARLRLIPATLDLLRLEKGPRGAFSAALGAEVPATWPPEHYDDDAVNWLIRAMEADPECFGWMLYYVVLLDDERPQLVGSAGFKGRADSAGRVEIGYGVVAEHQRRGIASEVARALVRHAFSFEEVRQVTAATHPEHRASKGVMQRCGMRYLGDGPEAGTVLYGIGREEMSQACVQ